MRTPLAFSSRITASPIGPQPMTIATVRLPTSPRRTACQATAIGSVSAATSGGRPLGTGIISDSCTSSLLGVGAGRVHRQPDGVHAPVAAQERQRDDVRPGRRAVPAPGAVLGDLAAELVAEHDRLLESGRSGRSPAARPGRPTRRSRGARAGRSRRSRSEAPRCAPAPVPARARAARPPRARRWCRRPPSSRATADGGGRPRADHRTPSAARILRAAVHVIPDVHSPRSR